VAVLVLKRYSDAVANGDRIWGLIRGSAVVQEGPSKMMGTPTVECEALAMSLALERAEVHPNEVSYVETHGTGTPVGDPLEVAAVTKAYSTKDRIDLLTIGSVKTNIGHTESVSGLAGIIKTLLSLKNEMIPPHLNFKTLSPDINLSAIPAQLPLQAIEWKKSKNKPRIAGVSSFGITGTDAHVIIQETPDLDLTTPSSISDSRIMKLFTLSGKSEESLMEQIKMYSTFLSETNSSLEDIE
jgi:acyl transferase domain-containing protein